jgi:quercetin dioxygenase-like cupin family protein
MQSLPSGFALAADEGERLRFGDAVVVIKASAETTGGAFSIVEENEPLDTPRHVHAREDELFYVLEGEHVYQVGADRFHVGPGAVVFAPRGVPHEHRRIKPRTGRFLTMCSPAGFEGFFRELAAAERDGSLGPAAYERASRDHGITWLGP